MKQQACYQWVGHCIDNLATGDFSFSLKKKEKNKILPHLVEKGKKQSKTKQNHHQSKTKPVSTVLLVPGERMCKCVWTTDKSKSWQ